MHPHPSGPIEPRPLPSTSALVDLDPELVREHPELVGKPDGVPHDIVGILAFMIVIIAMAIVGAYLLLGVLPAIIIAALVTPFIVVHLSRRSSRERTEEAHDPTTGPGPA